MLDLSGNCLSKFPDELLECGKLEMLKLSGNQLSEIPVAAEQFQKLKELHIADNHLQSLPAELGYCTALEQVDCSSNQLSCIPESLGNLKKLRRLILNNNAQLKTIPSSVLRDCVLLHTLEMHGTMVSREVCFLPLSPEAIWNYCQTSLRSTHNPVQVLQGIDGYDSFEKRRQNKFTKAIDGNAMIKKGGVDEGVDVALS